MKEATPEEIADALVFALQYDGRKRVDHAADFMAYVAAEHLVKHLRQLGYVVMKKPEGDTPSWPTKKPPLLGAFSWSPLRRATPLEQLSSLPSPPTSLPLQRRSGPGTRAGHL